VRDDRNGVGLMLVHDGQEILRQRAQRVLQ
jgi:hypothetical protein